MSSSNFVAEYISPIPQLTSLESLLRGRCLTVNIITKVVFGESLHQIDTAEGRDFDTSFTHILDAMLVGTWDVLYLPVLRKVMNWLPPSVQIVLGGANRKKAEFLSAVESIISNNSKRTKASINDVADGDRRAVVFDALKLNATDTFAEVQGLIIAGSDTTATSLTVCLWKIVQNPSVYSTLKKELGEANLVTKKDFDLVALEQLPYLVSLR